MSNNSSPLLPSIPYDTAHAVASSFDERNFYIRIGTSLETICQGLGPAALEHPLRQAAIPAYVLALATVFQYLEKLTDEEMARSVRNRPEIRYGLRLAMRHPVIPASGLCRYRRLLFENPVTYDTFYKIAVRVAEFTETGNGVNWKNKRTLPERICLNDRADRIMTTMLEALGSLAAAHPNWMREITPSYWYERYNRSSNKFVKLTLEKDDMEFFREIGNDIKYLLDLAGDDKKIAGFPEIRSLKLVFAENFDLSSNGTRAQWKPISCNSCLRTMMQVKEAP